MLPVPDQAHMSQSAAFFILPWQKLWLLQTKQPSLKYLDIPASAPSPSHLKNSARIVPPHSPHLITFSEPTSLPGQNIAIKAQLPTLNLTLEWFSLLPSARTTGHHRMMALRLPCLIKLINAYQGQKWMPIFTVFFMVQLQRRGCLCSVSFALDELQVQMPFSHDTYTLGRKLWSFRRLFENHTSIFCGLDLIFTLTWSWLVSWIRLTPSACWIHWHSSLLMLH